MRSRAAVESRVANGRDLRYLNNTVTITIENLPIVEVESTHKNSGSKGGEGLRNLAKTWWG